MNPFSTEFKCSCYALRYDEVERYDFKTNTFTQNAGHFTQVVWVSTTEIGDSMVHHVKLASSYVDHLPQGVLGPPRR